LTWRIELTAKARKQLSKIDRHAAHRIVKFLRHLENLEEPRQQGKALQGQLAELTSTAPPAARRPPPRRTFKHQCKCSGPGSA